MKISITGAQVITQMGMFSRGDILSSNQYDVEFLKHLVNEAGAAVEIKDLQTPAVIKKKSQSIPSSEPDRVSTKKTATRRKKIV